MIDFLLSLGWWLLPLSVLAFYYLFLITWALFVALMEMKRRLPQMHWFSKFNAYVLLFTIGYPLDLLFNVVASPVIFQSLPKGILFTGTLKHWINSGDKRRSEWAAWICKEKLHPYDPGHCE